MTTGPDGAIQAKSYNTNSMKVQCIDMEIYKITQKYFDVTKTEFYSFALFNERTLKKVMKRLFSDITAAEVAE